MAERRDTIVEPPLAPARADVMVVRVQALRAERDELRAKVAELRARAVAAPLASGPLQAQGVDEVADQQRLVFLRERCEILTDRLGSETARANAFEQRLEEMAREVRGRALREQAAADVEISHRQTATMPPAPADVDNEPAWVRARITSLGAARADAQERLTALRLRVATTLTDAGASGRRIARLEEELRATREALESVDEERRHLSNEIQRMLDQMHGA